MASSKVVSKPQGKDVPMSDVKVLNDDAPVRPGSAPLSDVVVYIDVSGSTSPYEQPIMESVREGIKLAARDTLIKANVNFLFVFADEDVQSNGWQYAGNVTIPKVRFGGGNNIGRTCLWMRDQLLQRRSEKPDVGRSQGTTAVLHLTDAKECDPDKAPLDEYFAWLKEEKKRNKGFYSFAIAPDKATMHPTYMQQLRTDDEILDLKNMNWDAVGRLILQVSRQVTRASLRNAEPIEIRSGLEKQG